MMYRSFFCITFLLPLAIASSIKINVNHDHERKKRIGKEPSHSVLGTKKVTNSNTLRKVKKKKSKKGSTAVITKSTTKGKSTYTKGKGSKKKSKKSKAKGGQTETAVGSRSSTDCSGAGNGYCESRYNHELCDYDGNDCFEFNSLYPSCVVPEPKFVGDGLCDNYEPYNTAQCGWDGGDCENFPVNCDIEDTYAIGDGNCNIEFNTTECLYDGGDCLLKHDDDMIIF